MTIKPSKTEINEGASQSTNSVLEHDHEKLLTDVDAPRGSKQIDKYYQRQNEIQENFKNDSEHIEAFRRANSRKRALHLSESSTHLEKRLKTSDDKNSKNDSRKNSTNLKEGATPAISKDSLMNRHEANIADEIKTTKAAGRLANITLFVNFTLMVLKITASVLSGSMSIISSMVDSVVDLTSGLVLSISARMIQKRDPYLYPRGRTRLEPLSLILISVIMGMASVQLIISSCKRIHEAITGGHEKAQEELDVTWPTVAIMGFTICIKMTLFLICQKYKSNSSIKVLAMDHRNDCISNSVALACAWIAKNYWYYMDPIGAIVVSIYILYTWIRTGTSHVLMLSGKSAKPEFINRIIKVCMDHDARITHIDTVYVYHYGTKFLVEVHIVLNEKMQLKETHDIAESLQINIESLPEVERAFVHTDYDYTHNPQDEHKTV